MDNPVLASTFVLTLLLCVGLTFFIRASVKDRTETAQFVWEQSADEAFAQIQQYFQARSYAVVPTEVQAANNLPQAAAVAAALPTEGRSLQLAGFVRPSWFLAIFLSFLAAVGFGCLALVLAIAVPAWSLGLLIFPALSPLAGWFYWRQAGRVELVGVGVQPTLSADPTQAAQSQLTVVAHRDEVIALQQAFPLKRQETD